MLDNNPQNTWSDYKKIKKYIKEKLSKDEISASRYKNYDTDVIANPFMYNLAGPL